MIDYELYNERRQQLIDYFEEEGNFLDLIDILDIKVTDILDNLEWEDNKKLAELFGWTTEEGT